MRGRTRALQGGFDDSESECARRGRLFPVGGGEAESAAAEAAHGEQGGGEVEGAGGTKCVSLDEIHG